MVSPLAPAMPPGRDDTTSTGASSGDKVLGPDGVAVLVFRSPMGSTASVGEGIKAGTRGVVGGVMSNCRVPAPAADGRSRSMDLSFSESPLSAKNRYR
ncbi:hypothetical protein D9M68_896910 [compost metagenome]